MTLIITPGIMTPNTVEFSMPKVPTRMAIATITLEKPSKNTPMEASRSAFLNSGILTLETIKVLL